MKTINYSFYLLGYITLAIYLFCLPLTSLAQDKHSILQPYEVLSINDNGNPTFIDFVSTKINADEQFVYDFLKNTYSFDENTTFTTYLEKPFLNNGSFIRKSNQYYKGYKVEFGQVIITYKNNNLLSLGTNIIPIQDYNPVILISENDALKVALQDIGAKEYAWQSEFEQSSLRRRTQNPNATYYPEGELVIIDKSYFTDANVTNPTIAYVFTIQSSQPFDVKRYYIDSSTGEILHKGSTLCHATGEANITRYSGKRQIETERMDNGRYRLYDATRGINTIDMNLSDSSQNFTDNDNNWTTIEHTPNHDDAALDAHWGAGVTFDYFQNIFGRNGWDNQGGAIENRVHVNFLAQNYLNDRNATWVGGITGGVIQYGDGNGEEGERASPMTALDIVAHEIAHGIVQTDGNLVYDPTILNLREATSIQEGLSDIWGAMVEYHTDPTKDTYLAMGEISTMSTNERRSLSNPSSTGNADTYQAGNYWLDFSNVLSIYSNSTIMSHWFYILAEGKQGTNGLGNPYNITGIGKRAVTEFLYETQVAFFSTMKFRDVRNSTVLVAINKWGRNSDEAKAVCEAWYAVGVGGKDCFFRGKGGIASTDGNGNPTDDDVSVFCGRNTSKIFVLFGVDATSNVVWAVSDNLRIITQSNTSTTISVTNANNVVIEGHGYVSATIDGTTVFYYDIWVGSPQVEISYFQISSSRVDVRLIGTNGTDVYKQGITNVDWNLTNLSGSCTPTLNIHSPANFLGTIEPICTNWSGRVNAVANNGCESITVFKNIGNIFTNPLDPGGPIDPLPCPRYVEINGIVTIVHCQGIEPDEIIDIDIYNYMGIHKATYKNTDTFSVQSLPLGLYLIKAGTRQGQFFTLRYIKE